MYKEAISEFQQGIDLNGGSMFLGFREQGRAGSVSPDGSLILFAEKTNSDGAYKSIWVMQGNGEGERQVIEAGENSPFPWVPSHLWNRTFLLCLDTVAAFVDLPTSPT